MIAPGIRVARGPDWIWQNQGNYTNESNIKIQFIHKGEQDKRASVLCCQSHFFKSFRFC